jgi:cytochrome c oxidase subunit 2
MLFRVKVVSQADYQAHLAELKAEGNTGPITKAYNRLNNDPGTGGSPTEPTQEGSN